MGWTIFAIWMVLGIFINLFIFLEKFSVEGSIDEKIVETGLRICVWIGIALLFVGLLYVIGWLWYYFCCGFLVFEEPNFVWKIIYGLMTLIPLGFFIGFIAICFGWDPWK